MVARETRTDDSGIHDGHGWGVLPTGPTTGNRPRRTASSDVGRVLRAHRERTGTSQKRLARQAGIDHTTMSRIESGTYDPSRKMVEALAAALELTRFERVTLHVAAGYVPDEYRLVMMALLTGVEQ